MSHFSRLSRCGYLMLEAILCLGIISCSTQKNVDRAFKTILLTDSSVRHAHIGVALAESSTKRVLYDYNGDKYFIPASNIKIITCYVAMKHLGDSLEGIRYAKTETGTVLLPTGDPTLLHPDYPRQPAATFLRSAAEPIILITSSWQSQPLGNGWSWEDYNEDYMPERSALPVYGNVLQWTKASSAASGADSASGFEQSTQIYSLPEVNWRVTFNTDTAKQSFLVQRAKDENIFTITEGKEHSKTQTVPFVTHGVQSALELLKDTIGHSITSIEHAALDKLNFGIVYSQPLDSLLKPMMYRSDNFFAEQALMMVSNKRIGVMNDVAIIDTLLKSDLEALPQKPQWADGSGLSRYNLFSPRDFVYVLDAMQTEFSMERMKRIFPGAGQGTLRGFSADDKGFIYAKTGSLSGVMTFSGYLITKKNKLLLFSILLNNYRGPSGPIRKKIESFLKDVHNRN